MFNKKFMLMAVFLVGLLAISTVSANDGVDNAINETDSLLQLSDMSDTSIKSTNDDSMDKLEETAADTSDDEIISMSEDVWFYDKVVWYDGDYNEIDDAYFDFVDDLEDSDKITIQLVDDDDNGIANVDLAFLIDYDNSITKLTTDSDGIAIYYIPLGVDEFSFCVGFWYNETHLSNYASIGQTVINSFNLDTWYKDYENGGPDDDDSNEFFIGNKIYLSPLDTYLPEVPDPTLPTYGSITIDFTKPIVDEDYPRVINLANNNIQDDALNKYGNVEVNGRNLILKSLNRANYTMAAEVSGKYYYPISFSTANGDSYNVYIPLGDVPQGRHNVKIYLYGDPKFDYLHRINYYPVVEMTLPIYINSGNAISVAKLPEYSGGEYAVSLTNYGNPIANVNVQMVVNSQVYVVKTDSNGNAGIYLQAGEYNITSSYDDVSTTSRVTVKSTIATNDAVGTYLNSKVSATFLNTNGQPLTNTNVNFKIGTATYSATTNSNGVATADIPLNAGIYTVTATNPVNNEQKQFRLTISKALASTAVSVSQDARGVTFTATLTPATATGNVTFLINGGETYYAVVKNGKASITLRDLNPGTYDVGAIYGGDSNFGFYIGESISFKVDDVYPILTANDLTKTYGNTNKFVVNLVDNKGNAIANANVNVDINGEITPITTDSNGQATMPISLKPATYTAKVTYGDLQADAQIVVKKATPKLTASAKTFKKSDKTKKYIVTLKNNKNAVIKNAKVTLKVNGKTYTTKVNTKGQAIFKLTKLTKKGTFTATVKYAGSNYYNAKTVKPKITVK